MTTASLRDQQADLTRQRILSALIELVHTEGVDAFSIQQVASRAGVSERTVYRHFPSRAALIEGLAAWCTEELAALGVIVDVDDLDQLPDALRHNYRRFEQLAETSEALVVLSVATRLRTTGRQARDRAFRDLLGGTFPGLSEGQLEQVVAVVRLLGSMFGWFYTRNEFGLTGRQAGSAAAWALEVLLEALRAGRAPPADPELPGEADGDTSQPTTNQEATR